MYTDPLHTTLRRDPAHIKEDMRRNAERLWGLGDTERDRLDPLVDLLLGAFSQELFTLQQDVARHKRNTLEAAVQALLPDDLTTPMPAHAVMHGRPVDEGTWTHRTRTVFSTMQRMDVHDRTGTSMSFTPTNEFRLYNGMVRHLVYGEHFHTFDAKTGQRRSTGMAEKGSMPANECWVGLELNERIPAENGLPLFFFLPTGDPEAAALVPQLASCTYHWGPHRLDCEQGLAPRHRPNITFRSLVDPVRMREREAELQYRPQFITLRGTTQVEVFLQEAPPPEVFPEVFGKELTLALDRRVKWLRIDVPSSMSPQGLGRLHCSMNCFPAINRKMVERTAAHSRLLPISHATDQQFWAMDKVTSGTGKPVVPERLAKVLANGEQEASYAIRRSGMERLDEREAYERLLGLTDAVRSDHAAFAALGETQLARGLGLVQEWLEEYRTRQVRPGYPPVYVLIQGMDHHNAHVHYWITNGSAASHIPALKAFQLDSGAYLADCRSITAPSGGSDTPDRSGLRDRLRSMLGTGGNGLPTAYTIQARCMDALPNAVREEVEIKVQREVAMGQATGIGFHRQLAVTLRATTNILSLAQWQLHCGQLEGMLNTSFHDLLPVRVCFQEIP